MVEYMNLINENAGVVALIGIIVSIIISCFLRWQGYERGQNLRDLLFWQEVERKGHGSFHEEMAWKGSTSGLKKLSKESFANYVYDSHSTCWENFG